MKSFSELRLLRKFLEQLGLSRVEQQVYTSLVETGTATVLTLAKASGINRTTTYRLLERLKSTGLVEEIVDEHRLLYRVSGSHILDQLIKEKARDVRLMQELFPTIAPLVNSVAESSQPGTKVLFYRGSEGIKQMVWNVLKTKKEMVGYTYRSVWEITGIEFANSWYREFADRHLYCRDIYSDSYLGAKNSQEIIDHHKYFESRYIPPKVLDISYQTDIYNDVVGLYNWHEGEVFGVEIYNEKIARRERQLFEIVWKMGKTHVPK